MKRGRGQETGENAKCKRQNEEEADLKVCTTSSKQKCPPFIKGAKKE
jgi:hypothetical protein